MDRLLNLQTALSLGYVGLMVGAAHVSSLALLPPTSSLKTRLIFLWLAFDAICHLTLEGSFLYLSVRSRTVNSSSSFFGYLWQEYAVADSRWGTADPTVVALEFLTVLIGGPLAGYCAWLLAKGDASYHYWVVVLSTGELYGGFMTFAPEWLTGSKALDTSNWLLLWCYLFFMNTAWVVIPFALMVDSYGYIVDSVRARGKMQIEKQQTTPRRSERIAKKADPQSAPTGGLTSSKGLSGTAYTLVLVLVFLYIMPTASATSVPSSTSARAKAAYDPNGTTTILPLANNESIFTSLKSLLVPILLPAMLISFSLLVGLVQVTDKALRRVRRTNRTRRRKLLATLGIDEKTDGQRTIIGFFHPYCNAGGGGERVLYEALSLHLSSSPSTIAVVYTGDHPTASKSDILAKASTRFGIEVDESRVAFVGLERRWMVEDKTWKTWTLLGQSYGSVWLGFEALSSLLPDVYVDTMGYAFTYPIVKLLDRQIPVGAYVHYPVISTDMLNRVEKRQVGHTNDSATTKSWLRSTIKLVYYRLFARAYSWALGKADAVVANGSWTQAHLQQLLGEKKGVELVYPPCDTANLSTFPLASRSNSRTIVSLAQFRPEKEHPQQLHILAHLLETHPHLFSAAKNPVKLVMMGSSRNEEDEKRISLLRILATQLKLDEHVEFVVNANYDTVVQRLGGAGVGLSTMKDEHFGINVVEFMAAGLVTISHKSAGPYLDIAFPSANHGEEKEGGKGVGFHAESTEEFARVLAEVFEMDSSDEGAEELERMRQAGRERAQKVFGREAFKAAWERELWSKLEAKLAPVKSEKEKKVE